MARNSGGTYTRVSNSFSSPAVGTTISPSDAESFFDEIESEITDSYSRSIKGGMLANGTNAAPAFTWSSDLDSGLYRIGADNIGLAAGGTKILDVASTGLSVVGTLATSGAITPAADDGSALGSTSLKFADLFLASGAVINFNSGDVTLTHSANTMAFAGASTGYTFDSTIAATDLTVSSTATLANTGLHLLDTNASHDLIIAPGSNLSADRTFTITTGDANRTLDISAADLTLSSFAATLLDDADAAAMRATIGVGLGTGDLVAANNLSDLVSASTGRLNISAFLRGGISGLTLSNNGTDATNDIDIAIGEAASDSTTPQLMRLTSAITKRLDANWAAGTGNGMRNSAAAITDTTYHIYLVSKALGADADIYAHASATVATVITALQAESGGASYVHARRIGSIIRASSAIVAFIQNGDYFLRSAPAIDVSATNPGTSAVTRTLSVPTGIKVLADCLIRLSTTTTGTIFGASITDLDMPDAAPSGQISLSTLSTAGTYRMPIMREVMTNTSGQIRSRLDTSDASTTLVVVTHGWWDSRGKE